MDKPNVMLIFADQMRGDCLRCDGNTCIETPHLDWLAARGTRFPHAYTATPSCLPARATLMTGMNPWHTGVLGMGAGQGPIPNDFPFTLAGELSKAGYRTHLVGKGHFHPQRAMMGFQSHELDESGREEPGFKSDYRQWFLRYRPFDDMTPDDHGVGFNAWQARPWHTEEHLHPTAWTVTRAMHFLEHRDKSMPFFLNVSFARPHSPYVPPPVYWDMYANEELPEAAVGEWAAVHDVPIEESACTDAWHGKMSPRQIRRARVGYYGDVSFIDAQIGRLLNWMARKQGDALRNTLIIFSADHGDMLGDHNLWRKTYAYEGSTRIPMIVTRPASIGEAARRVADEPVDLSDIMPTILDAAGVDLPPTVDGRSLLPLTQGPVSDWRAYVHGEHCACYSPTNEMQFVTDGRRKFVWLPRLGHEQFFDLQDDPLERVDLIDDPARQEEIEVWRRRLATELEARECGWAREGRLLEPSPEPLVSPWRDRRYTGRDC